MIQQTKSLTCSMCGKQFKPPRVNGKLSYVKTCSRECATKRMSDSGRVQAQINSSIVGFDKGWSKTFEKPMDGKRGIGPAHQMAKPFSIVSPDGTKYEGVNLKHFVRANAGLFQPETVVWVPAKKYSKIKGVRFRPSRAVGRMTCRAAAGLAAVVCGRRKSWKGWTK